MSRLLPPTLLTLAALSPTAHAGGRTSTVEGEVVLSHAEWTADGRSIVTTSQIVTDDGRVFAVAQLGGTVGDLVSAVSHEPTVLAPADHFIGLIEEQVPFGPQKRASIGPIPAHLIQLIELDRRATGLSAELPHIKYVRSPAAPGPIFWTQHDFTLVYDAAGTDDLPGESEFAILDQAFRTWQEASRECDANVPRVQFRRGPAQSLEVNAKDRINLVKFRDQTWGRPDPKEPNGMRRHNPKATAITTITWRKNTGELVDADIEFNAVHFGISDGGTTLGGRSCLADLGNTATHEAGHFLGLDHTCWDGDEKKPRGRDQSGMLVPYCAPPFALPEAVRQATMYNFQPCAETSKRDLTTDDIAGLCATLRAAETRRPADDGGCSSAARGGDGAGSAGGVLLLALLLVAWFRAPVCSRVRKR